MTIQTKSVNPNKDVSFRFSDLRSENKGFQFESAAGYVQYQRDGLPFLLLSCESWMFVNENPDRKNIY